MRLPLAPRCSTMPPPFPPPAFIDDDLASDTESDDEGYDPLKDQTNPELAEARRRARLGLLEEKEPESGEWSGGKARRSGTKRPDGASPATTRPALSLRSA